MTAVPILNRLVESRIGGRGRYYERRISNFRPIHSQGALCYPELDAARSMANDLRASWEVVFCPECNAYHLRLEMHESFYFMKIGGQG